jgi:hypothetical protein
MDEPPILLFRYRTFEILGLLSAAEMRRVADRLCVRVTLCHYISRTTSIAPKVVVYCFQGWNLGTPIGSDW